MTETEFEVVAKAKVATVLSASLIALNLGSAAGIREGDKVRLHNSIAVSDPDTAEELGTVRLIRATFSVTSVQERICVAVIEDRIPNAAGNFFDPPKRKTITASAADADAKSLFVQLGEEAVVVRAVEPQSDEPPF